MNDEKLLELYLIDLRKRRFIIIVILILIVIIVVSTLIIKKQNYEEENKVTNLVLVNSISNESVIETMNETIEKEATNIVEETELEVSNKEDEIIPNDSSETDIVNPEIIDSSKEFSTKDKEQEINSKSLNKDFLFVDGYTMENVTQAAQDYLRSTGYAGECVPIKDNEGIYLGMRVIFY